MRVERTTVPEMAAVGAGSVPRLIILDEEGQRRVFTFEQQELTVGRSPLNAICLPERNVSRKHVRLLREDGDVFVEDLSAGNLLRLNGEPIQGRVRLNAGDR